MPCMLAAAPITNVVFMGMGEPLHNTDAVLTAIDILCHPLGLHLSHNKASAACWPQHTTQAPCPSLCLVLWKPNLVGGTLQTPEDNC